jgi:hypothetical protein
VNSERARVLRRRSFLGRQSELQFNNGVGTSPPTPFLFE